MDVRIFAKNGKYTVKIMGTEIADTFDRLYEAVACKRQLLGQF